MAMRMLCLLFSLVLLARQSHPFTTPRITSRPGGLRLSTEASDASMYENVKAVIFDVDGTLADSWKLGFDATIVVLKNNNIPVISEATYHECTKYATPERLARHAGLEPGDADFETTGQALGQEFDDLYVGLVDTKTAGFYPGIHDLIEGLPEGVKLGALTNAAARYADAVLEVNCPTSTKDFRGALYSRFSSIQGADTVPKPKPAPDGLFLVCEELGVDPTTCVYIGDSPSDAGAAAAAGMPAVGVLWGSHPEESLAKAPFSHLCRSVEELKAILPH